MAPTASPHKSMPRAPVQQPAVKRQHKDLQQQNGVGAQRTGQERLRRSQADQQSDAI